MRIGIDRAAKIIELLCEGMSVRAVARVTDTHMQTITDLLVMVGERCEAFMADSDSRRPCRRRSVRRNLAVRFLQTATAKRKQVRRRLRRLVVLHRD